ncbi:hypothetical protein MJ1HA_1144 [Metallosphaera sedula]|nr:hypothetical protein MJ1HA_1144 [Metallosphaera sedula]
MIHTLQGVLRIFGNDEKLDDKPFLAYIILTILPDLNSYA